MAVTQEGLVLYYVHDDKKVQIEALCLSLSLRAKQLKTSDLNERTGVLAEIKGLKMTEVSQNEKAPMLFQMPEILIFSGIPEKKLDEFLTEYRKLGIENIKLKAVLTSHNVRWTLYQLLQELMLESLKFNNI